MIERFFQAINHTDYKAIKDLLKNNPELKDAVKSGSLIEWHVIHLVTALGYSAVLDILVQWNVNLNLRDAYGWAATHHAVFHDHFHCLQILLQAGAGIDALTKQNESLVLMAASSNKPKILRYLISKGADLKVCAISDQSPVYVAVTKGHLECLQMILESSFGKSPAFYLDRERLLSAAISCNQIGSLHILLSHDSANSFGVSDMMQGTQIDIKYYLDLYKQVCGLQKNQDFLLDINLLNTCLNSGGLEAVIATMSLIIRVPELFSQIKIRDILAQRVKNLTALFGFKKFIKTCFLLCSPQVLLAIVDQLQILKIININSYQDNSIYKLAIEYDQARLLRALLNHYGSQFLQQNKFLEMPLHTAVRYGSVSVLDYLIKERNLSVEAKNQRGERLVHYAVRYGRDDILSLLIHSYHASIECVDSSHNSLLHLAVLHGSAACINVLFKAGFHDVNQLNSKNESPLTLAKTQDNQTIFSMLSEISEDQGLEKIDYDTIVFQGGGVKGIGFYGSAEVLINEDIIDLSTIRRVGGTSAGAITALVLAVGYNLQELGKILRELDFFTLLENECRDEFFSLYETLHKRHGIEELLGKRLYSVFLNLKSGNQTFFEVLSPYIASKITETISPLGLIHTLAEKVGIHENEYQKLMQDIQNLKDRLMPFVNRIKKHRGLFDGEVLRKKFISWINDKGLNSNLTFHDLHMLSRSDNRFKDLYVAAYDPNTEKSLIFSYETTPDSIIADAVRSSMSIQIFFVPHKDYICEDGVRVQAQNSHDYYDGGSLYNFILDYFDRKKYVFPNNSEAWLKTYGDEKITNHKAMGFRLVSPEKYAHYEEGAPLPFQSTQSNMEFLSSLLASLSTFSTQEDKHDPDLARRTVHINTLDIDTVEFNITEERKSLLIESGRTASKSFVKRRLKLAQDSDQAPSFLKYYFSPDPFHTQATHFVIPHNSDIIFSKLLRMAQSVSAKSFQQAIKVLCLDFLVRDSAGNTLFHHAVELGDICLLEKLYSIRPALSIENAEGFMPLDHILYCRELKLRERILEFFVQRNVWFSKILSDASCALPTSLDKRDYILQFVYKHQITALPCAYVFSSERHEHEFLTLQQLAKQKNVEWDSFAADVLMNYVYLLIKKNRIDLLNQLSLSIDQSNHQGITVLHIFVMQNDKSCVERCMSSPSFAYPNIADNNGETALDKLLEIQSFSTEDTLLQRRLMAILLLRCGVLHCSQKNKSIISTLLAEIPILDLDYELSELIKNFNEYNKNIDDFSNDYRFFKRIRDNFLINEMHQKNNEDTSIKGLPQSLG